MKLTTIGFGLIFSQSLSLAKESGKGLQPATAEAPVIRRGFVFCLLCGESGTEPVPLIRREAFCGKAFQASSCQVDTVFQSWRVVLHVQLFVGVGVNNDFMVDDKGFRRIERFFPDKQPESLVAFCTGGHDIFRFGR